MLRRGAARCVESLHGGDNLLGVPSVSTPDRGTRSRQRTRYSQGIVTRTEGCRAAHGCPMPEICPLRNYPCPHVRGISHHSVNPAMVRNNAMSAGGSEGQSGLQWNTVMAPLHMDNRLGSSDPWSISHREPSAAHHLGAVPARRRSTRCCSAAACTHRSTLFIWVLLISPSPP